MSDDLISRKALIEEISSLRMYITGLRAGKGVLSKYMEEYRKSVIKCIEEAPTAYDDEAVCEEIQNPNNYTIMAGKRFTTIERAIETVRNGGKK